MLMQQLCVCDLCVLCARDFVPAEIFQKVISLLKKQVVRRENHGFVYCHYGIVTGYRSENTRSFSYSKFSLHIPLPLQYVTMDSEKLKIW